MRGGTPGCTMKLGMESCLPNPEGPLTIAPELYLSERVGPKPLRRKCNRDRVIGGALNKFGKSVSPIPLMAPLPLSREMTSPALLDLFIPHLSP